jgi:hypothetical protein
LFHRKSSSGKYFSKLQCLMIKGKLIFGSAENSPLRDGNAFLFLREEGILLSELEPPTATIHPFPLPTDPTNS